MVANLPYSVATPVLLRTIDELPSVAALDGDGPARDRRPAAGGARQPHLRLAERARPARLRGEAAAHGRPGRVHAPAAGRLGDARLRRTGPGADPAPASWSAPPSPTGASRWRARSSTRGRARSTPPARPWSGSACPRTPAPRRSAPEQFAALCGGARAASRELRAPDPRCDPRPRQAQPLPLPRAAPRGRAARALLAVRAAGARRPDRGRPRPERRRGHLPGRRGPEPGRRRARGAARAGLGPRRRCGSRSRSGSRSPPGSAAAAPTPRRSCGWPAGEVDGPRRELAGRARRRRALAARSRPSRWSGAPASGSSALPDPAAARGRPAPRRRRARRTAEVFAEADRLGLGRGAAELEELGRAAARRGRRRRLAARLRRRCSSTTSSRRRSRCAREIAEALDGPARGGRRASPWSPAPARPPSACSPTSAAGRRRAARRDPLATTRSSRRRQRAVRLRDAEERAQATAWSADRDRGRRGRRRYYLPAALAPDIDLETAARGRLATRSAPGPTCSSALFAFLETGAFVGLVVPGRDGDAARRRRRRPGRHRRLSADRDRLVLRLGGRHDELLHRPPARARLRAPPRPEGADHPRALRAGRGLLRPPRRQDDPHRPLHRPRPRAGAVHRRQLGDALPRLRPVQHPRHRALGHRPHPDRLLLLAQHRHRRQVRRQRGLRARRR